MASIEWVFGVFIVKIDEPLFVKSAPRTVAVCRMHIL